MVVIMLRPIRPTGIIGPPQCPGEHGRERLTSSTSSGNCNVLDATVECIGQLYIPDFKL